MKFATIALTAVLGAVVLVSTGCTRDRFPVVTTLTPQTQAGTTPAPEDADYFLFADNQHDPAARTYLHAGDPVGFASDARDTMGKLIDKKGVISAVAGEFVVKLTPGVTYEWRRVPHSSTQEKLNNESFLFPSP